MKCGLKGKPCFLRRKQRWLQTALTATWYRVLIDIGIDMSYSFHLVAVFAESSSSALQLAVCMLLGSSGIGRQQWPKNTRSHGPHRSASTPSIVKDNNPLNLVWSKWGSQCQLLSWIWKALQSVAISHLSRGFLANEKYWSIPLKTNVSLSLICREERSRV